MNIQFQGVPLSLGVLDVIDIIVVAYFLYRLYVVLENTRAATLIKGLVILFVLRFISRFVHLNVINWILEQGMTMIMVALPVVFQPELRRALEQLGRGRMFSRSSELTEKDLDEMLDAVVNSCQVMAEQRVGALIVFEGFTGLEERIDTGVQLDALVSEPTLQQIFIKDTPLHDGAIIIRGNRIIAASCVLILTDNRNLDRSLGTRHRAAIGVSEQSDCVAVVVSEETGIISVAKNGTLMRYVKPADLRSILDRHVKSRLGQRDSLLTVGKKKLTAWWEGKKNG